MVYFMSTRIYSVFEMALIVLYYKQKTVDGNVRFVRSIAGHQSYIVGLFVVICFLWYFWSFAKVPSWEKLLMSFVQLNFPILAWYLWPCYLVMLAIYYTTVKP